MTVRVANARELQYFRTDGQWSKLYLAFPQPAVVFQAQINQVTVNNNMLVELTYDNVTLGAFADIMPDMTILIGSTAGARDLGIARIRKTCTATKVYLGETSELYAANDKYITVIDDYGIFPRIKYTASGSTHIDYMDRDVAYTDQHTNLDPVPVLGPDRVLFYQGTLGGGNIISAYPDASDSYCLGSSISTYLWTAPGASATANLTTATPTLTYNSPGTYRISCLVTATNGKTFTGRRTIVVYDDTDLPVSDFTLTSCSGDYNSGGWQFKINMYDSATLSLLQDRSRVILFSRDWYGDTEISIGQVAGCENIIASGWIAKEDLTLDINGGVASFTAYGPNYWLGIIPNYISGLTDDAAAGGWNQMDDLTVGRGVWDILHWKATCTRMMDVIINGCTQLAPTSEVSSLGSMWEQVKSLLNKDLLASACCDRYGRMFIEVNSQYIPIGDRSFTTVMTVQAYDRIGEIELERQAVPLVSSVDLAGVYYDGTTGSGVHGIAPGNTIGRYGSIETIDRILVADQAHCTELAGLLLAQRNNEFPSMNIELCSNVRLIDICPNQQLYVVTSTDQNPRQVTVSNNVFPRNITPKWNAKTSSFSIDLRCEPEVTFVPNSIKGNIPTKPDDPDDYDEITYPPIVWPEFPPIVFPEIGTPYANYSDLPVMYASASNKAMDFFGTAVFFNTVTTWGSGFSTAAPNLRIMQKGIYLVEIDIQYHYTIVPSETESTFNISLNGPDFKQFRLKTDTEYNSDSISFIARSPNAPTYCSFGMNGGTPTGTWQVKVWMTRLRKL